MDSNVNIKLEEFLTELDNSELIREYKEKKMRVLSDKDFLKEIEAFHKMDVHSSNYKEQKSKLFQNEDYRDFLHLEQELYYLTLYLTKELKGLVGK